MVAPSSKIYTVSTVLFHKDGGENIAVTNYMSHISMFVPTKATLKLANGNIGHSQGIGIILYSCPNRPIIYPVGPVYYCPGHSSNTISLGALKSYVDFQKVTYEPLEHCDFVYPQGCYWRSTHQTQNNLYYLQIKIIKYNLKRNKNILVPTVWALSKLNLYHLVHNIVGRVSITRLRRMAKTLLMKGLPKQSMTWKSPELFVS